MEQDEYLLVSTEILLTLENETESRVSTVFFLALALFLNLPIPLSPFTPTKPTLLLLYTISQQVSVNQMKQL